MARPPIEAVGGVLFKPQIEAALDYVEGLAGGGIADGDKGDITVSGAGTVWTVDADTVTNAKLANMVQATFKGRAAAAGTGDPVDLTATEARTILNVADGAQVNVATDLAYTAGTRLLASSTGADVTLPLVASADAGLAPASGGGTTNFLRADGTWNAPPAGGSVALTDLTDVTIAAATQGQALTRGAAEFQNLTMMTMTLGPFFINDLPGTATTQATIGYFNTATALSRNGNDIRMDRAGRVVGLIITSDAARTAGTGTAAVRIAGVGTVFDGGSVQLNGTTTTSDSSFVAYTSGVAFTAGDTVGAQSTTVGWTPITANIQILVVVMLEPF